jgi:hypothetical protein
MPNHVSNTTTITGPAEDIARFREAINLVNFDREDYSFVKVLLPIPEELLDSSGMIADSPEPHPNWANLLADGEITQEWHDELVANRRANWEQQQRLLATYGYPTWYEWALENYGTKWGDYEHGPLATTATSIVFHYNTAWSPLSEKFWWKLSQAWPTLTFVTTFDESGMAFYGAIAARSGIVAVREERWPEVDAGEDGDEFEAWEVSYDLVTADLSVLSVAVLNELASVPA